MLSIGRRCPDAIIRRVCPVPAPMMQAESWGAYCLGRKPSAMLEALDSHPEEDIVYCADSDMFFLRSPEEVPFPESADLLVTPGPGVTLHSDQHPMVNSGFVGVRNTPRGRELLGWWHTRCQERCTWLGSTSPEGYLARALRELDGVKMCEHPGVNLARWNKLGPITVEDGMPCYGGRPIICFHCQAFDPRCDNKTGGPVSQDIVDTIYPLYEQLLTEVV